jgi:hypothetical protein
MGQGKREIGKAGSHTWERHDRKRSDVRRRNEANLFVPILAPAPQSTVRCSNLEKKELFHEGNRKRGRKGEGVREGNEIEPEEG